MSRRTTNSNMYFIKLHNGIFHPTLYNDICEIRLGERSVVVRVLKFYWPFTI